jgi:hypothetical protein
MSSQYAAFYEMSHIPCPQNSADLYGAELGTGKLNIDGRFVVAGGVRIEGKCIPMNVSKAAGYHVPGAPMSGGIAGLAAAAAKTAGTPQSTQVYAMSIPPPYTAYIPQGTNNPHTVYQFGL